MIEHALGPHGESQFRLHLPSLDPLLALLPFPPSLLFNLEVATVLGTKVLEILHRLAPHLLLEHAVHGLTTHACTRLRGKLELVDVSQCFI